MRSVVLLLAAVAGASAYKWDVKPHMIDLRGVRGEHLIDSFRVLPNRPVAIYGKSCPDDPMTCGKVEASIHIKTRVPSQNLALTVAVYTREVEDSLRKALNAQWHESLCKGYALMPGGDGRLIESDLVQKLRDSGDVVLMNASFEYSKGWHTAVLEDEAALPHTDLWILNVAMCDRRTLKPRALSRGDVVVNAELHLSGYTGELDAKTYVILQFHLYNFVLLCLLLVLWGAYGFYMRSAFGGIHVALTVMLVITAFEQLFRYMMYNRWNDEGDVPTAELYFVLLFEAFRKVSWCFLLSLLVNGYRSINATLGESNIKLIVVITAVYFFICALSLLDDPRKEQTRQSDLIQAGQSAADLLVYVYIFLVLHKMIEVLDRQAQHTKRKLFSKLHNVLTYYIVVKLVFLIILIVVFSQLSRSGREELWRMTWLVYAMFPIVFEQTLVALMFLWRPSEESVKLMYAIELNDDNEAPPPDRGDDGDMFSGLDDQLEITQDEPLEGGVGVRPNPLNNVQREEES